MAYTRLTAAEAAALIKNGDNLALSGFTPAGVAKAVTKELAKIATAEHEAGREFKVGIFTGVFVLEQQVPGDICHAVGGKCAHEYGCAQETRLEAIPMFCKVLPEPGNHSLPGLPFYQSVLQGEQGRGLHGVQDIGLEPAVSVQEGFLQI